MKIKIMVAAFLCALSVAGFAQLTSDRVYVGVKAGAGMSWADYSQLKNRSPKSILSPVGGIFAEFEFGDKRMFSLRPEINWLKRGTKISDDDLDYKLSAGYMDVRLPFVLNFGDYKRIRPFVYVAPVLGFVNGGKINYSDAGGDYEIDVTKANIASTYFAAAVGAGVKIPLHIVDDKFINLGFEVNYQHGLTDTYGGKELDGEAIAVNRPSYYLRGNRKLHGVEIVASVSVPLSIFKKKPKKVEPVIVPEPVVVQKEEIKEEVKECYTIEEILMMVGDGKSVAGKTICAIDMINFEFDRSIIKKESYPYIDKIVRLMKNVPIYVVIKGHTDNRGSEEYNMKLSKERAEAVYNYMISAGVDKGHLKYEFYGMSRPIADNATPEGRVINRRVEFEIVK